MQQNIEYFPHEEKRRSSDEDNVLFSEIEPTPQEKTVASVTSNLVDSPKMALCVEVPIPNTEVEGAPTNSPWGVHQLNSAVRVTQSIFSPKIPPAPSPQKYRYANYDEDQKATPNPYRA